MDLNFFSDTTPSTQRSEKAHRFVRSRLSCGAPRFCKLWNTSFGSIPKVSHRLQMYWFLPERNLIRIIYCYAILFLIYNCFQKPSPAKTPLKTNKNMLHWLFEFRKLKPLPMLHFMCLWRFYQLRFCSIFVVLAIGAALKYMFLCLVLCCSDKKTTSCCSFFSSLSRRRKCLFSAFFSAHLWEQNKPLD